jgi:hypothetical protein
MGYSKDRARLEAELARAHRALYYAEEAAERMEDFGMSEDLKQLQKEVTRLAQASLKDKKLRTPQIHGQMQIG